MSLHQNGSSHPAHGAMAQTNPHVSLASSYSQQIRLVFRDQIPERLELEPSRRLGEVYAATMLFSRSRE